MSGLQRADELIVVHHDDTVSHFTGVRYTLGRSGLRVLGPDGAETVIACHDVLTTHVKRAHSRTPELALAA